MALRCVGPRREERRHAAEQQEAVIFSSSNSPDPQTKRERCCVCIYRTDVRFLVYTLFTPTREVESDNGLSFLCKFQHVRLNERAREKPLSVHSSATCRVGIAAAVDAAGNPSAVVGVIVCSTHVVLGLARISLPLNFSKLTHARTYSSTRFVWRRTRSPESLEATTTAVVVLHKWHEFSLLFKARVSP